MQSHTNFNFVAKFNRSDTYAGIAIFPKYPWMPFEPSLPTELSGVSQRVFSFFLKRILLFQSTNKKARLILYAY